MTSAFDDDQPDVLDSLLGEVFGGEQAPDVTERVLAALQPGQCPSQARNGKAQPAAEFPRAGGDRAAGLAIVDGRPSVVARSVPRRTGYRSLLAIAVTVLLMGSLLGWAGLWWYSHWERQHREARLVRSSSGEPEEHGVVTEANGNVRPQEVGPLGASDRVASREPQPLTSSAPTSSPGSATPPRQGTTLQVPFGPNVSSGADRVAQQVLERQRQSIPAREDAWMSRQIDELLSSKLLELRLVAAQPATEAEFCRRAFVRLLGRIPTVDELQAFIKDASPDKRLRLVRRITESAEYREEFAEYWAQFWTNALLGRTAGTRSGDMVDRQAFVDFVREAIREDRPWNQLVERLLLAEGSGRSGSEGFDPAVNFFVAHRSPDATVETGAIARLFLARRYQCAQCHNHPFVDGLTQEHFWQLNAFLRQMRWERQGDDLRLVDADAKEDVVFYERIDGYQRAVYPVLPDGTAIPTSGKIQDVRRREWLARWVSQSAVLSQAIVNRVWAHFFGYGFTRPIDEIAPGNPISHPELLKLLAEQFEAHQYSLRRLITWIAQTEAFGRSSRITEGNVADMPEVGQTAWFSRYYTRQMQPEAVYDSLYLVAQARRAGGTQADRLHFLGQFAEPMGTDDREELFTFSGDIRQSLLLMTGQVMQRAMSSEESAVLRTVIRSSMTAEEKITHLFLAAVSRPPTERELQLGLNMMNGNPPEVALQDIWWALLNSNEFILDH